MDINDLVNAEINVLTELNELLDLEREMLLKDNAKDLIGLIESKKLSAKKITVLENERIKIYGEIKGEDLVKEGKLDEKLFEKLKHLTFNAKEKGETNLLLTKQSINYIKVITSALAPVKRTITYGNNGRVDDSQARGVFSTKV